MDTAIFGSQYKTDETGCGAYDPKILLKVILLAYARGILYSRKIAQACREHSTFMALACGQVPDHSTLAAFVPSLKAEIVFLFRGSCPWSVRINPTGLSGEDKALCKRRLSSSQQSCHTSVAPASQDLEASVALTAVSAMRPPLPSAAHRPCG
jgi:hypothetical protein